ncbi:MAG: hypothetical protein HUJ31_19915, partial [Pseudomonadales bacterium]|nr:hypothetical protein [Pseudomonadales bacterium]
MKSTFLVCLLTTVTMVSVAGCSINDEMAGTEGMMSRKENPAGQGNDEADFLWLEDIDGERALEWVRARNEDALKTLQDDPRYAALRAEAEKIYTAS